MNGFSRKPQQVISTKKSPNYKLRLSKSMDDHMSRFCRLIPKKETIIISTYRLGNRGVGFLFSVFRVFLSRSYLRTSSTQLNHDIEVLCTLQSACTLVQNGQEEVRCRGRKPQDGLSNKASDQLSILRGVNTLFEGIGLIVCYSVTNIQSGAGISFNDTGYITRGIIIRKYSSE